MRTFEILRLHTDININDNIFNTNYHITYLDTRVSNFQLNINKYE